MYVGIQEWTFEEIPRAITGETLRETISGSPRFIFWEILRRNFWKSFNKYLENLLIEFEGDVFVMESE